jgi:hypothetical protein
MDRLEYTNPNDLKNTATEGNMRLRADRICRSTDRIGPMFFIFQPHLSSIALLDFKEPSFYFIIFVSGPMDYNVIYPVDRQLL